MINRVKELYTKENLSARAFAIKAGLSPTTINTAELRLESGEASGYSKQTLGKIFKAFPHWDKDYILYGSRDMSEQTKLGILNPTNYSAINFFSNATDVFINQGLAMYPLYKPGDIIITKRIEGDFIVFSEVYFIITKTDNFEMMRYLHEHESDKYYLLKAYNKEVYKDQKIRKSEILGLFKVLGSVFKA